MNVFNKKPSYSLDITLNEDFNGIMYGPPEESLGCKLKGKIILENKVSISARQLTFVFLGITTVSCGPPMSSSRPEYSETQTIYRKQLSFHNSAFSGKTIPIGIHEYHFEVDLPGSLPPSFKRSRGKIEYSCNAILERPRFHKDIKIKKIVNIQRCLMDQVSAYNTTITEDTLNGRIQYQLNTPIMVYREGGLVQAELRLKPMNSDIVIEAVEYGLKEQIHFRTTGEHQMSVIASINEDHYPLGKKEVATNPFFVNGSEPMSIQFRLCPWVNCDMDSPLIEIRHKISYTVCISESVPVEVESDSEPYGFVPPIRSRRYSVPVSINSDDESHTGSRRGRVHRTVSLVPIPNNTSSNPRRNSRTLSIRTILNSLTQTKIEKRRLNFEVPIIVTAKSERSRLRGLSYISDRPPDYAVVASMFPSPPEYHHNTSHENDLSHEDYLLQENEENDLSDDHEDTI